MLIYLLQFRNEAINKQKNLRNNISTKNQPRDEMIDEGEGDPEGEGEDEEGEESENSQF